MHIHTYIHNLWAYNRCIVSGRESSGRMYSCNSSSVLPQIYSCNVTNVSAANSNQSTTKREKGDRQPLDQTCSATLSRERVKAATFGTNFGAKFNVSSLSRFECSPSGPSERYTLAGTWCGITQYAGWNCSGDMIQSQFDLYNEKGDGNGECVPQPQFEGTS
jgi:hypothetical protein